MDQEFIFDVDSVWVVVRSGGAVGDEGARILSDPALTMWMDTERGRAVVLFTDSDSATHFAESLELGGCEIVTFASRHAFSEFLNNRADLGIPDVAFDLIPGKKNVRLLFSLEEVRSRVRRTIDSPEKPE